MSDSDRIAQLEKDIKEIKSKIRKDKKENPDYKKKSRRNITNLLKNFAKAPRKKKAQTIIIKKHLVKRRLNGVSPKKNLEIKQILQN